MREAFWAALVRLFRSRASWSNYPITFVLHNNLNYGLTTGQASSLTPQGQPMNTSPNEIPEHTLASTDLIFSLNPTFVARGFSGDIKPMTRILKAAIQHRGFAFIEMLQACPTYNHFATHEYLLDRYFDANAEGHEPSNGSDHSRHCGSFPGSPSRVSGQATWRSIVPIGVP
jgi:pyruvate/2-oxoacid:ferredoxin oxidoreductase beta subunit